MTAKSILKERYGTVGWEEFLQGKVDLLAGYNSAKKHSSNRPVQTEHGDYAEAAFREWLKNFLPQKYGVTSGFIIPDVKKPAYILKHYDVIIYNILESPTLWTNSSPDASELGKTRAIPANHVHAVIEVKANFTKKSIKEAKNKLKELNCLQKYLHDNCTCGVVFFEVKKELKEKCDIAEDLFSDEISGYFGGAILSAEGIDESVAGYFQFGAKHETVTEMPLYKELGGLQIDAKGNPQLTQQGDLCECFSDGEKWHFNKGYSPVVSNVMLNWSHNSLSAFSFDLIERIKGTFTGRSTETQGTYGMSFLKS